MNTRFRFFLPPNFFFLFLPPQLNFSLFWKRPEDRGYLISMWYTDNDIWYRGIQQYTLYIHVACTCYTEPMTIVTSFEVLIINRKAFY